MIKQVFYHYSVLEEHAAGMWRRVGMAESEPLVQAAADLMRDPDAFLAAMRRALVEWPLSVEAALSTPSLNERAYMGHAGSCIAVGSPEFLTRLAWHRLTQEEQDEANRMADIAIAEYREKTAAAKGWLW